MTRFSSFFSSQRHNAPAMASPTEPQSTSLIGYGVSHQVARSTDASDKKSQPRSLVKQRPGKSLRLWNWLVDDSWALEYGALILAAAAFASIVAVLEVYKDRPVSDWTSKVSLNTVISTVGIVMKGAVLLPVGAALSQLKWTWYHRQSRPLQTFQTLDAASRGPLGAATLLYELKFWHLASLGAGVTLLALVSDPFVQQTVTYPVRKLNTTASVPFGQNYTLLGKYSGNGRNDLEQSMKAAIYDGVMYSNVSETGAAISAQCPTGNCTFPPYASIAVCSKCADITSKIDKVCIPINSIMSSAKCEMHPTIPNGLQLPNGDGYYLMNHNQYNFMNMAGDHYMDSYYKNDRTMSENKTLSPDVFSKIAMLLVNISLDDLRFGPTNRPKPDEMLNRTIAFECIFSFCVQTYTGQVSNGVFTEKPGRQFTSTNLTRFWYYNDTVIHVPADHLPDDATNSTFTVVSNVQLSFNSYFNSLFNGTGGGNFANGISGFSTDVAGALFRSGPDKIPQSMQKLATSMTNNMRLRGGTAVRGTASLQQSYIDVRWLWLLLPLIMILGAAVFLQQTVWQSRRWGVPMWKSNALAVMVHGIHSGGGGGGGVEGNKDDDIVTRNDAVWAGKEKVSELDRWAEGVEVSLRRRGRLGLSYGLVVRNVDTSNRYSPVSRGSASSGWGEASFNNASHQVHSI